MAESRCCRFRSVILKLGEHRQKLKGDRGRGAAVVGLTHPSEDDDTDRVGVADGIFYSLCR
jgi:hypothetical protein